MTPRMFHKLSKSVNEGLGREREEFQVGDIEKREEGGSPPSTPVKTIVTTAKIYPTLAG